MIRKIMCWLGWHEWVDHTITIPYNEWFLLVKESYKHCKHCGRTRK